MRKSVKHFCDRPLGDCNNRWFSSVNNNLTERKKGDSYNSADPGDHVDCTPYKAAPSLPVDELNCVA